MLITSALLNPRLQNHETAPREAGGREGGEGRRNVLIKAPKWNPCAHAKWITSPQIERSLCVRKPGPLLGFRPGGALKVGVRVSARVHRSADGDRRSRIWQTAGWQSWEQPDRVRLKKKKIEREREEKLTEPVLIEKSADPTPAVRVQLRCCMLKEWRRIGVGWGEFRCQRECETNISVWECVCLCVRAFDFKGSQYQLEEEVLQMIISIQ